MIADRNKSELTHKVTDATYQWLDIHGFKPVETEVQVTNYWIADLAGVIVPTQTELIEMKMLARRPKYNSLGEAEWRTARKLLTRRMTCLVEVKTSRSDFIGDKKWKLTPPTDLAYLAVPPGMLKDEEWPVGWGILELRDSCMVQKRIPVPRVASVEECLDVVYQIGIRRDHRTRYAEHRQEQKEWRVQNGEIQTNHRIGKIINAIDDILRGHTKYSTEPITNVQQALERYGIKNVHGGHLEKLANIFGIAARTSLNAIERH
jgi:hypothetical protein